MSLLFNDHCPISASVFFYYEPVLLFFVCQHDTKIARIMTIMTTSVTLLRLCVRVLHIKHRFLHRLGPRDVERSWTWTGFINDLGWIGVGKKATVS